MLPKSLIAKPIVSILCFAICTISLPPIPRFFSIAIKFGNDSSVNCLIKSFLGSITQLPSCDEGLKPGTPFHTIPLSSV